MSTPDKFDEVAPIIVKGLDRPATTALVASFLRNASWREEMLDNDARRLAERDAKIEELEAKIKELERELTNHKFWVEEQRTTMMQLAADQNRRGAR